ncbi:TIGR01244 family protein [Salinihabitans flavidus]|uniref:TIGR01244 family protein n=1 Tax=Salinihabitans flavidus TaxID=569882 RepID=A0A1H8MER4_9RHOB|nr:TIGR01244 family sulfur transferase [Salinihabitans flavidus]SEO15855.1 TIGR01244 family protein [Salinihabitans flavidus]
MDIRQITPRFSVSPQITVEDVPAIKAAGFTTIICNRPDAENPPPLQAEAIAQAARAAGLDFKVLPLTHETMTPDNVARQRAAIDDSSGPALAYCASGTRSTVAWILGNAGDVDADELLSAAARAGYQLGQLRPKISEIAANRG